MHTPGRQGEAALSQVTSLSTYQPVIFLGSEDDSLDSHLN